MPKKKKEKKKKKKKAKIRANRISMRASDLAWQKLIDDDSGEPYYFNSVTQETTWDEPPGFKGDGSLADIGDPFENDDDEAPAPIAEQSDEEEEDEFTGKMNRPVSTARAGVARDKWWEKKEEKEVFAVWQECTTDEGLAYYFNTETQETQWDKPDELKTAEELADNGEWLWIPDATEVFVPAKIAGKKKKKRSKKGGKVTVETEDGKKKKVELAKCRPFQRAALSRVVEDLTLLDDMSSQLILHNLKKRFEKQKIYTNVGNILISINPYEYFPIYTKEVVNKYINRPLGRDMPPHVYNISHDAYYGLTAFGQLQSVIISGESGAGKTEATKQCLQYLAAIAGSVDSVEDKILQANPILEAFGNAKTIRNDNSSRFGKYIEVYFQNRRIVGSATRNYLLEKIRVVQPATNERNFHIFYQLVKASPSNVRKSLHLSSNCMDYKFLGGSPDCETLDDKRDFKELEQAFQTLEFVQKEIDGLFSVVAAVMHLGNIVFKDNGASGCRVGSKGKKALRDAAAILSVDADALEYALTTRILKIRGQKDTEVFLTKEQALGSASALAKFVYGKMFNWVVGRVNESMGRGPGGKGFDGLNYIGMLDIFGFEIFKHNSFEQLCINFTNEMLQQHFNQNTFKLEEKIYKEEGVEFEHIDFIDNTPMIDLITKKPKGILPLLDEELKVPDGNDAGFMRKLLQKQSKNKVFSKVIKNPNLFVVVHYAGEVKYDHRGFFEKNQDALTDGLTKLLQMSKNDFINVLYPPSKKSSHAAQKASLSKQFQAQLRSLMRQLNRTEPHYVRCIKPNNEKAKQVFVPRNCYEQLTYSGVFEAVAIRKKGFPFRLSHKDFAERYGVIVGVSGTGSKHKKTCSSIISKTKLDKNNIQVGTSRVLYRAMEYRKLELDWSVKVMAQTIDETIAKLCKVDYRAFNKTKKERFFTELSQAVREADKFRVKSKISEQGRDLLERFMEERMDDATKRKLQEGYDKRSKKKLKAALQICQEKGWITKLVRKCAEILEQIEDAEEAIQAAIQQCSEEFLKRAIGMCDELKYNSRDVEAARELLSRIQELKRKMKKCKAQRDKSTKKQLKSLLKDCNKIGYSTKLVEACEALLKQIQQADAALEKAVAQPSESRLAKALKLSDAIGYKPEPQHVSRGKMLLHRIKRIKTESIKAREECIEAQVRVIHAAAVAVNYSDEQIEFFGQLLSGPREDFLREQFERAHACGHADRAIRINVERKDLLVAAKRATLSIDQFPHLKTPQVWAAEKFLGKKVELAARFLKFQPGVIHSPLTATAGAGKAKKEFKEIKNLVKANFKCVMKFMGQRKTVKMSQRIDEIFSSCLAHEDIRDELFLGIIKQSADNEEPSAVPRAFELLAIVLKVFPPSPGFEDFLQAWVREHESQASKHNIKGLLCRRVYEGVKESEWQPLAPNETIEQIMYEKRMYIKGAHEKVMASIRNLAGKFSTVKYGKTNSTWQDLKKDCYRTKLPGKSDARVGRVVPDKASKRSGKKRRKPALESESEENSDENSSEEDSGEELSD